MVKLIFFGARGVEFSSRHFARVCETPVEVIAVVDSPAGAVNSTNIQSKAQSIDKISARLGVPLLRPDTLRNPDFIKELSDLKPDLFISAGYWGILPPLMLKIPKIAAVNFHASLLPRHCGKHPVFWTLWYGDEKTGVTLHHMDAGIDTGDIVYVKKVKVLPNDTVSTLYNRIMKASIPLVDRIIQDAMKGKVPKKPQPKKGYCYNSNITERDLQLDFNQPAWLLERRVKIVRYKCYFRYRGRKYIILKCTAQSFMDASGERGNVIFKNDHVELNTSQGTLVITAIFDGQNELKPSQIKDL